MKSDMTSTNDLSDAALAAAIRRDWMRQIEREFGLPLTVTKMPDGRVSFTVSPAVVTLIDSALHEYSLFLLRDIEEADAEDAAEWRLTAHESETARQHLAQTHAWAIALHQRVTVTLDLATLSLIDLALYEWPPIDAVVDRPACVDRTEALRQVFSKLASVARSAPVGEYVLMFDGVTDEPPRTS